MAVKSVSSSKRTVVEPIASAWLHPDRPAGFPLYYKSAQKRFEIYCKPGESPGALAPDQLYINTKHRPLLDRHLASGAHEQIRRADLGLEDKSRFLYSSASRVLERFFADPIQKETLSCAADLARSSMDLIMEEPAAFSSLLKVSSHDYYTFSHSVDVMLYTAGLARTIGLEADEAKEFATGAILHDIGKSHIPAAIINKNGALSDEEFEQMKAHPDLGVKMLNKDDTQPVVQAVVYHHERHSGGGYPHGLKGDAIPFVAQMVTIADVFAALTTKRSYKPPMSSFEALRIMKEKMPGHFNPELFRAFVRLMSGQP